MLAEYYGVLDEATARNSKRSSGSDEQSEARRTAARVERVRGDLDTDRGWERF